MTCYARVSKQNVSEIHGWFLVNSDFRWGSEYKMDKYTLPTPVFFDWVV